MVRKSQELRPVMTRIPEGLRSKLAREARKNGRSMNAEIIYRLEQSFEHGDIIKTIKETIASHGMAVVIDPDKPEGEDKS
jgi:Arc-like DNA binding domain